MQLAEEHAASEPPGACERLQGVSRFLELLKSPLAVRAAQEAKAEDAEGRTMEERQRRAEQRREKQVAWAVKEEDLR